MMAQYQRLKAENRDAILFFRLGDFYEMFDADAREASEILEIALTKRGGVPMCGVPHHASRAYIARLLQAGRRVAVCEQVHVPEDGGLADREVVEVVTPGTAVDDELLDGDANNFLVAVYADGESAAVAALDVSPSELRATRFGASEAHRLEDELAALAPRELLLQESLIHEHQGLARIIDQQAASATVNRFPDWHLDRAAGYDRLVELLGVANLKAFGLERGDPELAPIALLLGYAEGSARQALNHLRGVTVYGGESQVAIDEATQRSLELVRNLEDGSSARTLLSVVDHTRTAMGARLLRAQLVRPLRAVDDIERRLGAVEALFAQQPTLAALRERLTRVYDLQRLSSRVALGRANGRDLRALAQSVQSASEIPALLEAPHFAAALGWIGLHSRTAGLTGIAERIDEALVDEPPLTIAEGGLIRTGFDAELDRISALAEDAEGVLERYLEEERAQLGSRSLRLGHNRQLGWYFEISSSRRSRNGDERAIPSHFRRRQSLTNSERFTTERLEALDRDISAASQRRRDREYHAFLALRQEAVGYVAAVQELAEAVAQLDLLQSLAMAATVGGYVRPTFDPDSGLSIQEGRHPVVESLIPRGGFVANDVQLGAGAASFVLLTGPNMAGKSTYLRQTAQIVLLAHIGSFVPAASTHLGVVDGIYCRVGASDNLARGESTFLVEMTETARILRRATERSLVILDEIGRGTSTEDGLAIAWAVCEQLLRRNRALTLFATHFRELARLEHPALATAAMDVVEDGETVVFLKRLRPGVAERSYGVHVAALAGVPAEVVSRAQQLLQAGTDETGGTVAVPAPAAAPPAPSDYVQQSLFESAEWLVERLASLDLERTSPMEAFDLIREWQQRLNDQL